MEVLSEDSVYYTCIYMGSNNVDMACALAVLAFSNGAAYFEERFYCVTVRYMYICSFGKSITFGEVLAWVQSE